MTTGPVVMMTAGPVRARRVLAHMLFDPAARLACSAWSFVDADMVRRFESTLARDLESGQWDQKFGHFRKMPFFEDLLKLIAGRI